MLLSLLVSLTENKNDIPKLQLTNLVTDSSVYTGDIIPGDSQYQIEQSKKAKEAEDTKKLAAKRPYSTNVGRQTQGGSVPYIYGYCTYYVAQKKNIISSYGNARNWPVNSSEPQVGAVVITKEGPLGHVAYVESVTDTEISLSEMNYVGFNKVSTRTISRNSWFIRGYLI